MVVFYRRLLCSRASAASNSDALPSPNHRFSFSQLRRATASFSPTRKIGQGGFGPVYRGTLPSGQHIAVKLMDSEFFHGEREFQNELTLAAKMLTMGSSSDGGLVVVPFGFCECEKFRGCGGWWTRRSAADEEAVDDDIEDGLSGRRLLLVYELMHNGSLQDALLHRRCPELMDWRRRFSVVVDIARGLHFLHEVCNPPVIHGDIKPSNILLDSRLSAKIADFGLAQLKPPTQTQGGDIEKISSPKIFSIDACLQSQIRSRNGFGVGDDDASALGETAEGGTNAIFDDVNGFHNTEECQEEGDVFVSNPAFRASPEEKLETLEVASTLEGVDSDRPSVDDYCGGRRRSLQDGGKIGNTETGNNVKDYVLEWIRSEIKKERPATSAEDRQPHPSGRPGRKKQHRKLEWWISLNKEKTRKKSRQAGKAWWREEFCEQLPKSNHKTILKSQSNIEAAERQWGQSRRKMKKSHSSDNHNQWLNGRRRRIRDCALSSTPSTRGTVCYSAPEFGGGRPPSEKFDIYSFGVLLLVIVSGRRPLQIVSSPKSELERANLISWARQLAHVGNLHDLIDPSLCAVDTQQALLCIMVALLCIQKSPCRRPNIKAIMDMLTGQSELPIITSLSLF
ncbi:hypothetical protein HPP92_001550 [Vanilla planifolia]|uniref:non-specific serine/threonine protein kinase n=1 Tax=Vanilla planifolia TaxID=51239 RepID=A0A835RWG3_VANPL|nr:hypothetical protein HPP92_001550 [Vanilla planifolia]